MKNISEEVQGAEHWLSLENTPPGSSSQANTYFPSILNGDDGAARWCIVFGRKVIDDGEDGEDDADDDGEDGEDDGVLF